MVTKSSNKYFSPYFKDFFLTPDHHNPVVWSLHILMFKDIAFRIYQNAHPLYTRVTKNTMRKFSPTASAQGGLNLRILFYIFHLQST